MVFVHSQVDRSVGWVGPASSLPQWRCWRFFVSISALSNDGADLPGEGSIEDIIAEAEIRRREAGPSEFDLGPLPPPVRLAIPRLTSTRR
jgi:hypothetical protein